ncbi:hypothetical protein QR685DRAFT_576306 [Neurospora intermedia]|uniref:Uncharacterized protein n=1 Tax=Neurospora intermedia TaxID=5142 RepID=A0ABR3CYP7_NEUIN
MCQTGNFRGPVTTTTSPTDEQLGQLRAGVRPANSASPWQLIRDLTARRSVERNLKPYLATDGKGRRRRGPFSCWVVGGRYIWRDGVFESRTISGKDLLALKSFAKKPNVAQRKRGRRAPRYDIAGGHFPDSVSYSHTWPLFLHRR